MKPSKITFSWCSEVRDGGRGGGVPAHMFISFLEHTTLREYAAAAALGETMQEENRQHLFK